MKYSNKSSIAIDFNVGTVFVVTGKCIRSIFNLSIIAMYDVFEAAKRIGVDSDKIEMCFQVNRCEPFPTETPLITEAGVRNAKTVLAEFGQDHFSFCDSLHCLDYPEVSIKS